MKNKIGFLGCFLYLAAIFFVGCGGGNSSSGSNKPSALAGHWEYAQGSRDGDKPEREMELFKDGSGVVDGVTVSWKVENKRFVILTSLSGIVCDYKVSGYELTLVYNDGDSATFVRKGKLAEFKTKQIEQSLGQFVYVKGGTFTMGCTAEQGEDCFDWEKPSHSVTVGDFYIGKTEVTQKSWRTIMGNNPSEFKGDDLPVESVSWNDVQKFMSKLNEMTGKNYRLPTEAEWEYAARGGNKSKGYKYSGSNNLGEVGWYYENAGDIALDDKKWDGDDLEKNNNRTHPVGQKKPNELGIYDMSGNVFEWCNDWYDDYGASGVVNPTGPGTGVSRVFRGGSWGGNAQLCRVADRPGDDPSLSTNDLGFRVAFDK